MLSGNESIAKYTNGNVAIWMAMAFQAGLINVGALLACGHPVSHISGYAAQFGEQLSKTGVDDALPILALPLAFLLGAIISGQLVDLRLKLKQKPKYYLTFGIVFLLVQLVYTGGNRGWFGTFGDEPVWKGTLLLATLSIACGILNGTVTTVSRAVVRTTHLTGPFTDLGIGIVRHLNRNRIGSEVAGEGQANLVRVAIFLSFSFGSVIGVFLFQAYAYGGFLLPLLIAAGLFGFTFYFQVWKTRRVTS